jgi:hypothetical protein
MHFVTDQAPLLVKLLVFGIAVQPLLSDNLRTSYATNLNNLALGAGGLLMIGIEHAFGWSDQPLLGIGAWIVFGMIGLFGFSVASGTPGGVVKTLMALLPWFPSLDFFIVLTAGFLLVALIGYATRRRALVAPSLAVACIGVWCAQHPILGFAACGAVLGCGWLVSRRLRPRVRDRMTRVRVRVSRDV